MSCDRNPGNLLVRMSVMRLSPRIDASAVESAEGYTLSTGGATGFPGDRTQASQHVVSGSVKCISCGTVATGQLRAGFDEGPSCVHKGALTGGLHTKRYNADVAKAPYIRDGRDCSKQDAGRDKGAETGVPPTTRYGAAARAELGALQGVMNTNMAGWPSGLRRWF
jgi:hypothetical protein